LASNPQNEKPDFLHNTIAKTKQIFPLPERNTDNCFFQDKSVFPFRQWKDFNGASKMAKVLF